MGPTSAQGHPQLGSTHSTSQPITADSLVQDVIERHPQTILVFVRHRLQCVGCDISPFHTIADSAREHAVTIEPLLGDLNQVLAADAT
jgi:hybrid cluster-associated redox disulfide protein